MGKASSSKKVARAAGTGGGRTNRGSTPWTYVGMIGLIVVVGLALTFTSRNRAHDRASAASSANATTAPTVDGTAWNEAVAFYICGTFQADIKVTSDSEGITTANGVIHIAPKVKAAAGKNATLGEFAKSVGLTLTGSELQLPGQKKYVNGDDCAGHPAKVYIKQFAFAGATVGKVATQDPPDIRLADKAMLTIAFVPPAQKSKIPAPPSSVQAALKTAVTPTTTTTTTTTTTPSTTTTTKPSTATTTTTSSTAKKTTTTTAGGPSTTAKGSTTTSP
jgi:hypothetical protein